jgi:DNA-binding transcriptional regulator PaaX
VVACDQAQRWAEAGLPDELAELDVSLGAVWAGVQLAPWGAERQAPVAALALSAETAEQIIVITTEQLLTTEPKLPAGSLPADWR